MDFIKAIQHATIGYGIRRAEWKRSVHEDVTGPDLILHLDHDGLRWVNTPDGRANGTPIKLCGDDMNYDLMAEDITADDWQVI